MAVGGAPVPRSDWARLDGIEARIGRRFIAVVYR